MTKQAMSFVKGMGAGMAAGATAVLVGKMAMKNKKTITKKAGKAARAIGDIFDDIGCMIK